MKRLQKGNKTCKNSVNRKEYKKITVTAVTFTFKK